MLQINTFQYNPADVDCNQCTKYGGKEQGCTAKSCPWLAKRIEAGVVGYEEAIRETFPHDAHLDARLRTVVRRFTGSLYLTPAHEQRMEHMKAEQDRRRKGRPPAYYAAMYLLTSNEELFRRLQDCFCKKGIDFDHTASQMGKSKQELMAESESIATTQAAYEYMRNDFDYSYGLADLLLKLDDPLQYLAARWSLTFDLPGDDDDTIEEIIKYLEHPPNLSRAQEFEASAKEQKPSVLGQLNKAAQEAGQRPPGGHRPRDTDPR